MAELRVTLELDEELVSWLREEAQYEGRSMEELLSAVLTAARDLDPLWYALREDTGVPLE